jgi:uncharacterized protein (TIGR03435 family)
MGRIRVAAAVILCAFLCAGHVEAQGQTQSAAQRLPREADPAWEVVAVRPSDPNSTESGFRVNGRHLALRRQSVAAMLMVAYGIQKKQIANAPDWVNTKEWEVNGELDADGMPDIRQIRVLVRKLLVDRFKLVAHTEQREMPVYALTVTKGGAKLEKSTADPNGLPDERDRQSAGESSVEFKNVPIGQLVTLLDFRLDRPVVDRTGLAGRYDFALKYTMDETRAPVEGNPAPGVFTALQEQLGLKLEPMKAAADVIVIDKVEQPEAN